MLIEIDTLFVGWYTQKTDGAQVYPFATISQNVIYYARWSQN